MERLYNIDFEAIVDAKKENDDRELIRALLNQLGQSIPANCNEYRRDDDRHALFRVAIELVLTAFEGVDCEIKSRISASGRVGSIEIRCYRFAPENPELFKAAILAADSLEIEGSTDGVININLVFFDLKQRVMNGSKN